jgi:septin 7
MLQQKGACSEPNAALTPVDVAVPNGHDHPPSCKQGLTIYTESNGAVSPAPPSRASPSPPTTADGPSVEDRKSSIANIQAALPQTITAKNPKLAAQMAQDLNIVRRKLTGYVGFANLPNQWHRKSVRKGFNFNVMVVGTSAPNQGATSGALMGRQVNLASESRPS